MDIKEVEKVIDWIKEYVKSAKVNGVVLGMSGGKDSLVVAALCVRALGKENVFGVVMPNGKMVDKADATKTCRLLEIPHTIVNINKTHKCLMVGVNKALKETKTKLNEISTINTPPRIRMVTLYAIAGSMNYLVANTSNLSEASVGYTTKWGDNVGDFAPLANFTKTEVCEMGILLGLPNDLVNKMPSDGLSGKSDEDNLGFSYIELDNYIRTGNKGEKFEIIQKKYLQSGHKRKGVIKYINEKPNHFKQGE